jgi:hypothetical protein
MSWRQTQLNQSLCDQDQIILQLFDQQPVKYLGHDLEFAKYLTQNDHAENLVLIINHPVWYSELISLCKMSLTDSIKTFYIGINRYHIKGNDTAVDFEISEGKGKDIINFVGNQIQAHGYLIAKSGHFDLDLGRYFNFVQPLTWLYGHKTSN